MAKIIVSRYRNTDGCLDYRLTIEGTQFHILKALAELGDLNLDEYDYADWNPKNFDEEIGESGET